MFGVFAVSDSEVPGELLQVQDRQPGGLAERSADHHACRDFMANSQIYTLLAVGVSIYIKVRKNKRSAVSETYQNVELVGLAFLSFKARNACAGEPQHPGERCGQPVISLILIILIPFSIISHIVFYYISKSNIINNNVFSPGAFPPTPLSASLESQVPSSSLFLRYPLLHPYPTPHQATPPTPKLQSSLKTTTSWQSLRAMTSP